MVTPQDLADIFNASGLDTPQKAANFLAVAFKQVGNAGKLLAAQKVRADAQLAHNAANTAAAQLEADAAQLQSEIAALIQQ